ncbi:unnamed protein product [Prorocentrum cordatum]|uniref:Uncharacterized protein n=1 Tax=Prorocentrum cordatum TaxID=2364126 RepID=A0ABN9WQG1_9DINO|nr:unnamed protein product [Polarella glacialis]
MREIDSTHDEQWAVHDCSPRSKKIEDPTASSGQYIPARLVTSSALDPRCRRAWTRKNDGRGALSRSEHGQFANRRVRVGSLSTSDRCCSFGPCWAGPMRSPRMTLRHGHGGPAEPAAVAYKQCTAPAARVTSGAPKKKRVLARADGGGRRGAEEEEEEEERGGARRTLPDTNKLQQICTTAVSS